MDKLRLAAVAACVVAWHNRNPLARRITAAQVGSIGYVALPFWRVAPDVALDAPHAAPVAAVPAEAPAETVALADAPAPDDGPAGGSLRERAAARARSDASAQGVGVGEVMPSVSDAAPIPWRAQIRTWVKDGLSLTDPRSLGPRWRAWRGRAALARSRCAGFSEDFMAPLSPRRVLRWARHQAIELPAVPADGPLREVLVDSNILGPAGAVLAHMYVATAAIEVGDRRLRVLLGPGQGPSVLGQRLWSPVRAAGAMALLGGLMLGVLWTAEGPAPTDREWAATPQPVALAASAAASAPELVASAPADSVALSAETAPDAGSPESAPAVSDADAPPPLAPPKVATVAKAAAAAASAPRRSWIQRDLSLMDLPIDDAAKALARETVAALRAEQHAASAAAAASAAQPSGLATTRAALAPTAAAPPPSAPVYALSTRLLRTRAESEQVAIALRALLIEPSAGQLELGVIAHGADWRVLSWPFKRREDAERARAMLEGKGLHLKLVDF